MEGSGAYPEHSIRAGKGKEVLGLRACCPMWSQTLVSFSKHDDDADNLFLLSGNAIWH